MNLVSIVQAFFDPNRLAVMDRLCDLILCSNAMLKMLSLLCLLCLAGTVSACLGPVAHLYPDNPEKRNVQVHVVKTGWHAGLVVPSEKLQGIFPSHEAMPEGTWIKVGWGDDLFYPDPDPPIRVWVRAAIWPSPSVLHIAGMSVTPEQFFPGSETVTLYLTEEGMREMALFLAATFRLDNQSKPIWHHEGRYSNSAFFKAHGRYYLPKTSNVYTAKALRAAGLPITPLWASSAGNVMRQARRVAEKERSGL